MEIELSNHDVAPIFEVKDDRFEVGEIASCHLQIEISKDRFRFAVQNAKNDLFMWLEDYHIFTIINENQFIETLEKIYKDHHFLSANYWKSISLSVNSPYFTFIPEELFQKDDESKYLNFAAGKITTDKQQLFEYHHGHLEAYNVFGVDKKLINWFKDMYPVKKITPVHLVSSMIEGIRRSGNADGSHVYFEEGSLVMVYFKDGKLQFCNRFNYRTPQDMAYHVLFVYNQLGLNSATKLTLYGEITTFSEAYSIISNSLSNLHFATLPSELKFSYFFEEMPEHRYCTLFSALFTY